MKLTNSYKNYKNFFEFYSGPEGYYEACEFLAFRNKRWQRFSQYLRDIRKEIQATANRLHKKKLNIADICCGSYGWMARHFYDCARTIVCIDYNQKALERIKKLQRPNVTTINADAADPIDLEAKIDFLYCGFNVYPKFIKNFIDIISDGGCIYLMKPKYGDDLFLRAIVKNYDLTKRYEEIEEITKILKAFCDTNYTEVPYSWRFKNEEIDKILAALSMVSLGEPTLLTKDQYEFGKDFLINKEEDKELVLSQGLSIWAAVKLKKRKAMSG